MESADRRYRVVLMPLNENFKPVLLALDEGQLTDMTSAMNYGSGWFRYIEGDKTLWLNMRGISCVEATPIEEERK